MKPLLKKKNRLAKNRIKSIKPRNTVVCEMGHCKSYAVTVEVDKFLSVKDQKVNALAV